MTKFKIKAGQPQPKPCPNCGSVGYIRHEKVLVGYRSRYDKDGELLSADYCGEVKNYSGGKIALCANCGEVLPFGLID